MATADSGAIEALITAVGNATINALNIGCRRKIGLYLDAEGSLIPGSDICNDWCGLAELTDFTLPEIESFKRQRNPTLEVLYHWSTRTTPEPTVCNLIRFLIQLQRYDVITDCRDVIERDVEKFKRNTEQIEEIYKNPNPVPEPPKTPEEVSVDEVHLKQEMFYDCFVIYNPEAPDQLNFVKEMCMVLEGPAYNLRLFVPWRDDLPGVAAHTISAAIIEKKCRRCIVILSKSFNNSTAADFQLKFAHALSPGARQKRVIPVLIEKCEVPSILNFVATAPFYNPGIREWQWPRVHATIVSELRPDPNTWLPEHDAWSITLDTSNAKERQLWATTLATQFYPDEPPEEEKTKHSRQKKAHK